MTDNEIVKALECCWADDCKNCPFGGKEDCVTMYDALDLINRQKAEIEMNDAEIKELRIALQGYLDDVAKTRNLYKQSVEELNQANAEIERLKKGWKADVILTPNVKAEAYKEFAERAGERMLDFAKIEINGHSYYLVGSQFFDNILKELVGEDDG